VISLHRWFSWLVVYLFQPSILFDERQENHLLISTIIGTFPGQALFASVEVRKVRSPAASAEEKVLYEGLYGEKGTQRERELRQGVAGQCAIRSMQRVFSELAFLWLPIHLNLLLRPQDNPAFLHASDSVGAQF